MRENFFKFCRYIGLYSIFRFFFREKLLILCYHGISIWDEHRWWPGVFMTEEKFKSRLELLKKYSYQVLPLGDALEALRNGNLPKKAVVITADDGYLNTPETILRACSDYNYPVTTYVTSYYSLKNTPIFNVMVQYLFWKTNKSALVGDFSFAGLEDIDYLDLTSEKKGEWAKRIIEYGRENCSESGRQVILKKLCNLMDFDYDSMKNSGMFMLMDSGAIEMAAAAGHDIQLHTHRHRFPVDELEATLEIENNRDYLEPLVKKDLKHFCYPSGKWNPMQHPWLTALGITSATTCQIGFNNRNSNPLALKRYLDSQIITENEFLAEVSGFLEFARKIRNRINNYGTK